MAYHELGHKALSNLVEYDGCAETPYDQQSRDRWRRRSPEAEYAMGVLYRIAADYPSYRKYRDPGEKPDLSDINLFQRVSDGRQWAWKIANAKTPPLDFFGDVIPRGSTIATLPTPRGGEKIILTPESLDTFWRAAWHPFVYSNPYNRLKQVLSGLDQKFPQPFVVPFYQPSEPVSAIASRKHILIMRAFLTERLGLLVDSPELSAAFDWYGQASARFEAQELKGDNGDGGDPDTRRVQSDSFASLALPYGWGTYRHAARFCVVDCNAIVFRDSIIANCYAGPCNYLRFPMGMFERMAYIAYVQIPILRVLSDFTLDSRHEPFAWTHQQMKAMDVPGIPSVLGNETSEVGENRGTEA